MAGKTDKSSRSKVEYLDREQIKALREKESEARKARAASMERHSGERIMSALDKLGQRLVESESERQSLKNLIDQARDHQREIQLKLEQHEKKQQNAEEALRTVKQQNSRLTRKLEQQDQARARLNRRMQRIENMAQDAQGALESKAMVLLTDQTIARESGLPYARADEPLPLAVQPSTMPEDQDAPAWKKPLKLSVSGLILIGLAAVGLGLLVAKAFDNNQTAFAVLQDGTLARINLQTGQIQPMRFEAEQLTSPAGRQFASTKRDRRNGGLAYQSKDWDAQVSRGRIQALDIIGKADLSDNLDRDSSLSGELKALEDQAFAGNAEAQHDLAALYVSGQGVGQSYERAITLFTESANAGIANAAYNLGVLYHQGLGVEADIETALDWYRRAALQNHAEAKYNLGIASIEGIGTGFTPAIAAAFFQQAAMAGIAEAAYNLALILENNLIDGADPRDSLVWYRAAMEAGSADARSALVVLSEKMALPSETAGRLAGDDNFAALVARSRDDQDMEWPEELVLSDYIPDNKAMILLQLQNLMNDLGLYNGPQDGQENETLRQAIDDYKRANGVGEMDMAFTEFLSFLLTLRTGV